MKNTIVLEMINNGEIEKLKELLTEEIYQDSLKGNGNAKNRYAAMKRYFKFVTNPSESFHKPCKDVTVHGKSYNSFCDNFCFALTNESIDTLETFDKTKGVYMNMEKLVNFSMAQSTEEINLNAVLADAKSKGYKYKKSEFSIRDFQYVLAYKDSQYQFGLLDKAFSIIDDGNPAEVYYNGKFNVLLIKTSIGVAGIVPLTRPIDNVEEVKTIIYVEN